MLNRQTKIFLAKSKEGGISLALRAVPSSLINKKVFYSL